jgi:L-rhamnose mutarotase
VETVCVRVRLQPGSLERVREWAAELNSRRDEVLATLRDEGVRIESVFLDGDTLVYYMRADDVEHARAVYARSTHAIDAYHQRFKDETFGEQTVLELLIDFENLSTG